MVYYKATDLWTRFRPFTTDSTDRTVRYDFVTQMAIFCTQKNVEKVVFHMRRNEC